MYGAVSLPFSFRMAHTSGTHLLWTLYSHASLSVQGHWHWQVTIHFHVWPWTVSSPAICVSPSASIRFQPALTLFSTGFSVGKAYVDAVNRGKMLNLTVVVSRARKYRELIGESFRDRQSCLSDM